MTGMNDRGMDNWDGWLGWMIGMDDWHGWLALIIGIDDWHGWLAWMTGTDDWHGWLAWMTGMDDWHGWLAWMTGMDDWLSCFKLIFYILITDWRTDGLTDGQTDLHGYLLSRYRDWKAILPLILSLCNSTEVVYLKREEYSKVSGLKNIDLFLMILGVVCKGKCQPTSTRKYYHQHRPRKGRDKSQQVESNLENGSRSLSVLGRLQIYRLLWLQWDRIWWLLLWW